MSQLSPFDPHAGDGALEGASLSPFRVRLLEIALPLDHDLAELAWLGDCPDCRAQRGLCRGCEDALSAEADYYDA